LSISYIKDKDTKEEFLDKKFKKSGSKDTRADYSQRIKKFEIYCNDGLGIDPEVVIQDLIKDWNKTKDVANLVNLLGQYHTFLQEDHPEITWKTKFGKSNATITRSWKKLRSGGQKDNMMVARLYLRARTGIKISHEDLSEKITIPVEDTEREEYPLTLDQFKKIYDKTTIHRRKVKYLFMRDTGVRTQESIQITKSMITFDYDEKTRYC
jgi:hypothetical protein